MVSVTEKPHVSFPSFPHASPAAAPQRSNALRRGFELAHGVNSTKPVSICCCVACGCDCRVCLRRPVHLAIVPAGSPSRGGDVKVCVLDMNQPSLPTLFNLFLCLLLSYGPFTCISFHKFFRQLSAFTLCSPSLISALLVLSTVYL